MSSGVVNLRFELKYINPEFLNPFLSLVCTCAIIWDSLQYRVNMMFPPSLFFPPWNACVITRIQNPIKSDIFSPSIFFFPWHVFVSLSEFNSNKKSQYPSPWFPTLSTHYWCCCSSILGPNFYKHKVFLEASVWDDSNPMNWTQFTGLNQSLCLELFWEYWSEFNIIKKCAKFIRWETLWFATVILNGKLYFRNILHLFSPKNWNLLYEEEKLWTEKVIDKKCRDLLNYYVLNMENRSPLSGSDSPK